MEKLHNLKRCVCSLENLYAAYYEAADDKEYRSEVLLFAQNLDENIFQLRDELLTETYTVGPYREFYVRYPKPRLVMALGFRDRIVQWAIYRQLNPFADKRFITHSYGCREGKGTLAAALQLVNWLRLIDRKADAGDWVIIKCDVSKYFYRVDHDTVLKAYTAYTDDAWFLRLMDRIINNPDVPFGLPPGVRADDCPRENRLFDVGMPIGNLTSQETANIYLDQLDRYCKYVLGLHFYLRYMDDFIILCRREEAEAILCKIECFMRAKLLLDLSEKTEILPAHGGCEFVGYRVTPHGLRLRKKTTQHIKRCLLHTAEMYSLGAIPLDKALEKVRCYYGMTKHCNGQYLRRWISENIILVRREGIPLIDASDKIPSTTGKRYPFYSIITREDGLVDVMLDPNPAHTPAGNKRRVIFMRGIEPHKNLEAQIRANYYAWCDSGEEAWL